MDRLKTCAPNCKCRAEDGPSTPDFSGPNADAVLISELLAALIKAEQALKDIIGAADNGQPYTAKELEENFLPDYNAIHAAIAKAERR